MEVSWKYYINIVTRKELNYIFAVIFAVIEGKPSNSDLWNASIYANLNSHYEILRVDKITSE